MAYDEITGEPARPRLHESVDRQRAWLRRALVRTGWAIQGVFDGPYAYTVGLTRYHDHPELIVLGLPVPTAGAILNRLGALVKSGHRLRADEVVADHAVERYLLMMPVLDSSEHLETANAVYRMAGRPPVPALQAVWSDERGRFPWQEGCSDASGQPLLFER